MITVDKKKCVFFFSLILWVISLRAQEPGPWQLVRDDQGLKIYTRTTTGSELKEIKARMLLNSSLSTVVAIINDFESYTYWVYKCSEARLLKSVGDSDMCYYHVIDAPWPMEDRDAISRFLITQNKHTLELKITAQGLPGYIPKKEGFTRLPKSNTVWTLTPIGPNLIQLEYVLIFDPGGELPAWLTNMFITDGPFQSLINLKLRVPEPKYRGASYPFVKEWGE
ncbi:MAG: START domain-containing protein [Bacteroidia bacterium]|nr:START domain-containing protein [Bacteroidia bacterium]